MASDLGFTQEQLNAKINLKTSIEYPTPKAREYLREYCNSMGIGLTALIMAWARRALIQSAQERLEGEELERATNLIIDAFPDRYKLVGKAFFGRMLDEGPEEGEFIPCSREGHARILALGGVIPCGPWRKLKLGETCPPGACYVDDEGTFYSAEFLRYNTETKRFGTFGYAGWRWPEFRIDRDYYKPTDWGNIVWNTRDLLKIRNMIFDIETHELIGYPISMSQLSEMSNEEYRLELKRQAAQESERMEDILSPERRKKDLEDELEALRNPKPKKAAPPSIPEESEVKPIKKPVLNLHVDAVYDEEGRPITSIEEFLSLPIETGD